MGVLKIIYQASVERTLEREVLASIYKENIVFFYINTARLKAVALNIQIVNRTMESEKMGQAKEVGTKKENLTHTLDWKHRFTSR